MEPVTLQQLAQRVGGQVQGNRFTNCRNAKPLYEAGPGDVTLVEDRQGLQQAESIGVAAVVTKNADPECALPQLVVAQPHDAFAFIVAYFHPPRTLRGCGVSPAAHLDPSAKLGRGVCVQAGAQIGADVVIGNDCVISAGAVIMDGCQIGNDVTIFPNVVLYANTILEDRVLVHSGSVLGAYGFGYQTVGGTHRRAAQLGYVHVESDVEIGACVTIDRGTYGATRIGQGTKIDNHVMIAHNCRIGRHNLVCSQVGIAGSSVTGDYCVLAGQVGLADHVHLGDRVTVGAQAGVMSSIDSGSTVLGSPAMPIREQMQIFALIRKLPMMHHSLRKLEKLFGQTPSRGDTRDSHRDAA